MLLIRYKSLNHKELAKHPGRKSILSPLSINIIGKEQTTHQKKMIGKKLRKIIQRFLLLFLILKITKYILPTFQNSSNREKYFVFLIIPNG